MNVAAPVVTVFVGVAIFNCTAAPAATEHVEVASVIVTTWPLPVAEPTVHVPKPLVSVTVGDAGTVKPAGNVTWMKSFWLSAPLVFGGPVTVALVVNPMVHVDRAPAVCGDPTAVTLVTAVFAAIVMFAPVAIAAVSPDVATVQFNASSVPWPGFVRPAMVTFNWPLFATAQVPPLFASVIVIVQFVARLDVALPAPQVVAPVPAIVIAEAREEGKVKPPGRTIVIVSLAARLPLVLVVAVIVQSASAPAAIVVAA